MSGGAGTGQHGAVGFHTMLLLSVLCLCVASKFMATELRLLTRTSDAVRTHTWPVLLLCC
jgi:hypothetical protein